MSIYYFNDLSRSYGIVQFESHEIGKLRAKLHSIDVDTFIALLESKFGTKVKGLSIAKGIHRRDETSIAMIYLRIEFEESMYRLEIYDESMEVVSDEDIAKTLEFIVDFVKLFVPEVIIRKRSLMAF